jgi:hypothetical protein
MSRTTIIAGILALVGLIAVLVAAVLIGYPAMAVGTAIASLGGVIVGAAIVPVIGFASDRRKEEAERAHRRWQLDLDSLIAIQGIIPTIYSVQVVDGPAIEPQKEQLVGLAYRVQDERMRPAVDELMALTVGSQAWRNQCSNVVRVAGDIIKDI